MLGGKRVNVVSAQLTIGGDHSSTNLGLPITGQVKQLKTTHLFLGQLNRGRAGWAELGRRAKPSL